ncbi:hypothetical protein SUDANB25_01932 [Streptomyces sp. SudanB25_2051]
MRRCAVSVDEEIAEQQADITGLLLHHVQAPLVGASHIRGVLPVPAPAEAVRVVTGEADAYAPDRLTAYEVPLRVNGDTLTAYDIIGILRTLHTGPHVHPGVRVGSVMGVPLVQVDPAAVEAAPPTGEDNALTILRTLTRPFTEERPDPRLRGFLFLERDRLRLYVDGRVTPWVIAADVRPSGAVTALLAALPSLITEEERRTPRGADPHCSSVVDLTGW